MSVLLNGRKIGSMHTTRKIAGNRVVTTQNMSIEIQRSSFKVALATGETDEETSDGKPLKFESRTKISGIESVQTGVIGTDGKLDVVSQVGGAKQTHTMTWPQGALLAEGLRLQEEKNGFAPGRHYTALAFQAENLEPVEVDSVVGAREWVDLPEGERELLKIEQSVKLGGAPTQTISWIEADQTVRKLLVPMMGYELTMLACSKACATAPNQSADILVHSLVPATRALSAQERAQGIRLELSAIDASGEPLQFANTDEQQAKTSALSVELRIAPLADAAPSHEDKPVAADTQPNDWLQSTTPEIVRLARQGAGTRLRNGIRRALPRG